jgi:hypothetical protein
VFDHPGRYADSDGTCRDFICHNGPGADNRSFPDSGAVKDNDPNTEPGFISNANAASGLQRLLSYASAERHSVIIGVKGAVGSDFHPASYVDRSFISRELTARLNVCLISYLYIAALPGLNDYFPIEMYTLCELHRTPVFILKDENAVIDKDVGTELQLGMMNDCTGRDVSFRAAPGETDPPIVRGLSP